MRFSQAIEVFTKYKSLEKEPRTMQGYALDLRQFCLYMRNPLITQVMPEHVIEYLQGMKELGWSQNSIMLKAVCLTQFFKFWAKKGYTVLNYELIPHVKHEYVQPKVADDDKINKLIGICDKHSTDPYFIRNKAMILLTADTGCRNGEICSLNLDINTESGEKFDDCIQYSHIIKTEKSRGKNPFRKVFWYDEANDALKKWIKVRKILPYVEKENNALFVGLGGQGARLKGQRVTVSNFSLIMRKMGTMAKVYVNPHSLRHMKGNKMGAEGCNLAQIADTLGHASVSSSQIYTHLNDRQLALVNVKTRRKQT